MSAVMQDGDVEFVREETRHTSLKRWCDCGCVIDGGEPYRYEVWKVYGDDEIHDLETCEPCAVNYSGSGGWWRAAEIFEVRPVCEESDRVSLAGPV